MAIWARLAKPAPTRVPGGDEIVNRWIAEWTQDRADVSALLSEVERLQTEIAALRAGIARVARDPTTANVATLLR